VKCHAITSDSPVVGGPSLADAKHRFTVTYVVESVLLRASKSRRYIASLILLDSGQSYTGENHRERVAAISSDHAF
jgi:hypothetical protein